MRVSWLFSLTSLRILLLVLLVTVQTAESQGLSPSYSILPQATLNADQRAILEEGLYETNIAIAPGDGSFLSPYRTIQEAVDAATPGSSVLVRAGVYDENVVLRRSGSDEAPISLISVDGHGKAQIRPVDENEATILGRGVENFVIKGFDIDGADNRSGIEFTQSGHDFTRLVRNIVIEDNHIHDVGIDGIKIAQAENVDIIGNLIIGGREEGIDFVTVWNSRVAQNEVRDVTGRGGIVVKGGSNNVVIEENYVHDIDVDGIIVGGWTDAELFHLFEGYQASEILVQGNYVQGVEKRPLNFLAAQDSVATKNFLDPQNDYFTIVNIEGDNLGYISKNLTIVDNVVTKPNWLHIDNRHNNGHIIENNQIGQKPKQNVGTDAYQQ